MRLSLRLVIVAALIAVCSGAPPPWRQGPDQPDVDDAPPASRRPVSLEEQHRADSDRRHEHSKHPQHATAGVDPRRGGSPRADRGAATRGRHGDAPRRQQPLELSARRSPARSACRPRRCSAPGWGPTSRMTIWSRSLRCERTSPRESTAVPTRPPGWWLTLDVKPGVVGRWARIERARLRRAAARRGASLRPQGPARAHDVLR